MERIELPVSSHALVRVGRKTGPHLLRNPLTPVKRSATDRIGRKAKMSLPRSRKITGEDRSQSVVCRTQYREALHEGECR